MNVPMLSRSLCLPLALGAALLVAAPVVAGDAPTSLPGSTTLAPVLGQGERGAIPGRYIVVLAKGLAKPEIRAVKAMARAAGANVTWTYRSALTGFAASLDSRAVAALRNDARVAFIEADRKVSLDATQSPATWGLDRIDQRNLPLNNSYTYNSTGAGVKAYIIDTGIRSTHTDFGGRVTFGTDTVADGQNGNDCNGHGTHVAGTVGGTTYGVAKSVTLVTVRVLNCQGSGSNSGVIAGVDWVTGNHAAGQPAVANMSLGGGVATALDTAVNNSINDGVTYAIAAGNSNANACNSSPARVAAALTVGATTNTDARASFSNYGTCLDIFAPGQDITSAWSTSNTATNTISGTSMAAPHVAGVAALYLQGSPSASPATVNSAIISSATTGVVSNPGSGSPNRLLYSLFGGSPPPPPPTGCTETYGGSLSGAGDFDYHPNGTYFYTANSGTHRGCLTGPSGTDFDLYLWKWNGSSWSTVAQGTGATSTENVTYQGTAGYYLWRVYSYSGSGSYTFRLSRP